MAKFGVGASDDADVGGFAGFLVSLEFGLSVGVQLRGELLYLGPVTGVIKAMDEIGEVGGFRLDGVGLVEVFDGLGQIFLGEADGP